MKKDNRKKRKKKGYISVRFIYNEKNEIIDMINLESKEK